jgi:hypothetical protein
MRSEKPRNAIACLDCCRPFQIGAIANQSQQKEHSGHATSFHIIRTERTNQEYGKMRKQVIAAAMALGIATTATATIAFLAGGGEAIAAETGTKTMPDSSVYPPPTPPPVFDVDHHECYLPLSRCDNNHRVEN